MTSNDELKPCPFCGSAATVPDRQELQDITGDTFVFCNNYNCEFDEEVTIKAWNTRAEPQAVDNAKALEALDRMYKILIGSFDDDFSMKSARKDKETIRAALEGKND